MSRDGRIKLTDFGVSRLLVDSNTQKAQMTRDVGTLLYMAPELFTSHHGYDTSADVYSYALVVLEVFTGEPPFAPLNFTFMLEFVDKVIARKIEPGVERLNLMACPDVIREVVKSGASFSPSDRPSMAHIYKSLTSVFKGMSTASLPVQKHMRGSGGTSSSSSLPSSFRDSPRQLRKSDETKKSDSKGKEESDQLRKSDEAKSKGKEEMDGELHE